MLVSAVRVVKPVTWRFFAICCSQQGISSMEEADG